MTAAHNSRFSLANSDKKVRKSVLLIIISEQVGPIKELRLVILLAKTFQGHTKKAYLDKLATLRCLWQCRILNLLLRLSHMGHSIMDFACFVAPCLLNRTSSDL